MLTNPPPCPPWCNVHVDATWEVTRTATTRTCERRVLVEDGGERHEYVLRRFAAIEYGTVRCDPPEVRVNDGDAFSLGHALNLAESLLRVVELAGEPSLAA